jgi:triacylglycerol lipase
MTVLCLAKAQSVSWVSGRLYSTRAKNRPPSPMRRGVQSWQKRDSETCALSKDSKHLSSWFVRWAATAPKRWLGKKSTIGQDITGGTHGLAYLRHLARGNRLRQPVSFDQVDEKSPPVLLIHGFLGTRGSMYPMESKLVEAGFCVFSFNLGALNTRDIRRSAFQIHRKIESILSQTSLEKIDIIGHSMGGLIGLYYIKKLGGHTRVRKLVMMGSPLHGTWVALLGVAALGLFSASSWQLLPRSSFLDELRQGPLPPEVEIHTLAAARDWVCPLPSTRLRGAHSTTVPYGHSSLVVSEDVYSRLIGMLRGGDDSSDSEAE